MTLQRCSLSLALQVALARFTLLGVLTTNPTRLLDPMKRS